MCILIDKYDQDNGWECASSIFHCTNDCDYMSETMLLVSVIIVVLILSTILECHYLCKMYLVRGTKLRESRREMLHFNHKQQQQQVKKNER